MLNSHEPALSHESLLRRYIRFVSDVAQVDFVNLLDRDCERDERRPFTEAERAELTRLRDEGRPQLRICRRPQIATVKCT